MRSTARHSGDQQEFASEDTEKDAEGSLCSALSVARNNPHRVVMRASGKSTMRQQRRRV